MRIYRLFLAVLLFVPMYSSANERELNQTIYSLISSSHETYENIAEDCAWALPYMPTAIVGGSTAELRSVVTNPKKGRVTNARGELIGEIWICVGELEEGVDPNFTDPEHPPYKRTIAFVIIIGDDVYGALGEWSQKTEYNGFEQEGSTAVWGGAARIVHIVDDLPTNLAGAMTYNLVDSNTGGYRGLLLSMRLFEPRNHDQEALLKAIRSSN